MGIWAAVGSGLWSRRSVRFRHKGETLRGEGDSWDSQNSQVYWLSQGSCSVEAVGREVGRSQVVAVQGDREKTGGSALLELEVFYGNHQQWGVGNRMAPGRPLGSGSMGWP